jgi:pescadillo
VPEYGETIKQLIEAAKKNVMPLPDLDNQDVADPQSLLADGIINRTQANEAAEERRKVKMKPILVSVINRLNMCRLQF